MRSRPIRARRGISPIIATVLLITIGVAAAAAVYTWAPTTLSPLTRPEAAEEYLERISIVEVIVSESNFTVFFMNIGDIPVEVNAIYVIDPETDVPMKAYTFNPVEALPGYLVNITLPLQEEDSAFINSERTVTFKLTTTLGTAATRTLTPMYSELITYPYIVYPSSYNLIHGTYVGGMLPDSVRWIDGNYFSIASEPTSTDTVTSHPSSYALLNETSLIGGDVEDLSANDAEYMVFESYREISEVDYHPSSYETLGGTSHVAGGVENLVDSDDDYMVFESYPSMYSVRAFTAYRSDTGSGSDYPKVRWWNGTGWEAEEELTSAGTIYWVRVASNPSEDEKIVAAMTWSAPTSSLYAYVWNGTDWQSTLIAQGLEGSTYRTRCFDVAYEQSSGEALIVYAKLSSYSSQDFAYRIWNGNSWSEENWVDDPDITITRKIYWMRLASKPGSNEIGLIYVYYDQASHESYVRACIWNGSAWGNWQTISGSGGISYNPLTEICGLAYESQSKDLVAASIYYQSRYQIITYEWTGSSWVYRGVHDPNPNADGDIRWIMLKPDPSSDRVMLMCSDSSSDLSTSLWTGTSWSTDDNIRHDKHIETYSRRCFDGDWEPSDSRFLLVWGHSNYDGFYYKVWTTSGWSSLNTYKPSGVTDLQWVRAEGCPLSEGDVRVMVEVMDDRHDITAATWNGSQFTSVEELTASSLRDYECFDLCFEAFNSPIKQTVELEFTGSSDSELWSSLSWGVEIGLNTDYANVQLQLYDYDSESYPSSGDGFQEFTAYSDDTEHFQDVLSNFDRFRADDGSWKMKVKVTKFSRSSFRVRLDLVSYNRCYDVYKAEVEFTGSVDVADYEWVNITWKLDLSFNVSGVTTTLRLYNYEDGTYASSGDGFDSFTASSAGVDYTRVNNVTTDPERFRSNVGGWKVKVSASILNTPSQTYPFTMSIDLVEYEPSYYSEQGLDVSFNFTDVNPPYDPENYKFTVTLSSTRSIELSFYFWNYTEGGWSLLGSYVWDGSGSISFTVNATQCVEGGIAKLRIVGSRSGSDFQLNIDRLRLLALQS